MLKKSVLILFLVFAGFSQKNISLSKALVDIGSRFEKTIIFSNQALDTIFIKTGYKEIETLDQTLEMFKDSIELFTYEESNKGYIVSLKKSRNKRSALANNIDQKLIDLYGYVYDHNGEALENAMVYIVNSAVGTYTDSLGYYEIYSVNLKQFTLAVQYIGYISSTKNYNLTLNQDGWYNFKLKKHSIIKNREVIVEGDNREWKRLYKKFMSAFLGESYAAEECEVKKPEYLEIIKTENMIYAWTTKPLILINKYTGYKVLLDITEAKLHPNGSLAWNLYPKFELLEAKSDEEAIKWVKNRKYVYRFSLRHFFKSLYEEKLSQNGFTPVQIKSFRSQKRLKNIELSSFFVEQVDSKTKKLTYDGLLRVFCDARPKRDFRRKNPSIVNNNHFFNDVRIRSTLKSNGLFTFNKDGIINLDGLAEALEQNVSGYFGFYRISGLLPIEYKL